MNGNTLPQTKTLTKTTPSPLETLGHYPTCDGITPLTPLRKDMVFYGLLRSIAWQRSKKLTTEVRRQFNKEVEKLLVASPLLEWGSEEPLVRTIRTYARADDVIFDVGAFIGLYSIYLANHLNKAIAYAFEPNPVAYEVLLKNIETFNLGNRIVTKNIALSDEVKEAVLHISSDLAHSSFYLYCAEFNGNRIVKSITVQCSTIDHLVQSGICRSPDIMKIDVEGHEYEVLKGATATLEKRTPKIFFEPHRTTDDAPNDSRIEDFLRQFGYRAEKLGYPVYCYKEYEGKKSSSCRGLLP